MLQVLYLVHDLADPAVRRRVLMLKAGGAEVSLAGFRRSAGPVGEVDGVVPIDLGATQDGRFVQRAAAIAKAAFVLRTKLHGVRRPDIVIARNLEMLALANRANTLFAGDVPIVYECLDIHRLLLRQDGIGRAMRAAERALGRNAALLITSSPAFLREYFRPFGQIDAPVALLENKVLELADQPGDLQQRATATPPGPWKIGWFGALRCRHSLDLLSAFTRRMGGRFEVVLRGRPAYSEFPNFDGQVAAEPHISFAGAYRNPEDLAAIYGEVHFSWAIDFFEEGLNSNWLLPNRLYEGCRHGAVPIAMGQTETGRFLADRKLGFLLPEPTVEALCAMLGELEPEAYAAQRARIAAEERSTWVCDQRDCGALVNRLKGLVPAPAHGAVMEVTV